VAIAARVPGRMKRKRWHNSLNHSIDLATGCSGRRTEDEDGKLKEALQLRGGEDGDTGTCRPRSSLLFILYDTY
jgi:hypothetical protein